MNDLDTLTELRYVGMACFVLYYTDFTNPNLSDEDIAEDMNATMGITTGAMRTYRSRRLISAGLGQEALALVANSVKTGKWARELAKALVT